MGNSDFKDAMIAIRKYFKSGYIANEKLDISNEPDEVFDYSRITKNLDENDLKNIEQSRKISVETLQEFKKVILKDTEICDNVLGILLMKMEDLN